MNVKTQRACQGRRLTRLGGLLRSSRGVAATEFALISPVVFVLLFGAFDIGHTLYLKGVLEGAVQKAARDGTLQNAEGTSATVRNAIDNQVKAQVLPLNPSAEVSFNRRFYRTFTDAAAAKEEEYTDTNRNGTCDANEPYVDMNNNGFWDPDGGDRIESAGARDNVVYTVTVEYPRLFPLHRFINVPDKVRLRASTVLSNQPYGDQESYEAPTPKKCL